MLRLLEAKLSRPEGVGRTAALVAIHPQSMCRAANGEIQVRIVGHRAQVEPELWSRCRLRPRVLRQVKDPKCPKRNLRIVRRIVSSVVAFDEEDGAVAAVVGDAGQRGVGNLFLILRG